MKHVTLSVPPPFSDGAQFDEGGELINNSWPNGLPYEGIKGWVNIGSPKGGLVLCEFVCEDDWPIGDIPGGWRANGSMVWDMVTQDEYDEDGNLVTPAINAELATDYNEYNNYQEVDDGNGNLVPRTEQTRSHVYLGWPAIRD